MSTTPPAGWYDDPEHDAMLRYWDGAQWTDHRAPGSIQRTRTRSGLGPVGSWLSGTWRALRRLAPVCGAFIVGAGLLATIAGIVLVAGLDDLRYADGNWETGSGSGLTGSILVALVVAVPLLWLNLLLCDQLYYAHRGGDRPLAASARSALHALRRCLGYAAAALGALIAWSLLLALLDVAGAVAAVGILSLAALPFLVWLAVRFAFILPALAVQVPNRSAAHATMEVSRGRFFPVVGRLVVLWAVAGLISILLSFITTPLVMAMGGTVDEGALDAAIVMNNDDRLEYLDVGEIVDAIGLGPGTMAVFAFTSAATGLVWLSGLTGLYAQTHRAPRDDA